MTREELKVQFKQVLDEMYNIIEKKNSDYGNDDNPWANMTAVQDIGISTTEKGVLIRMIDKIQRVSNLLDREAQVKDESIEDTLKDLANYSILLLLYIKNKKH